MTTNRSSAPEDARLRDPRSAFSTEPVPFTNGATVNVYDYGADNGSVG